MIEEGDRFVRFSAKETTKRSDGTCVGEHTSITQCTDLDLSKQIHTNVTVEIEFHFFPKGWWGLIVWEWEQKATATAQKRKWKKGWMETVNIWKKKFILPVNIR